jgi:hypothetical protein
VSLPEVPLIRILLFFIIVAFCCTLVALKESLPQNQWWILTLLIFYYFFVSAGLFACWVNAQEKGQQSQMDAIINVDTLNPLRS